MSYRAKVRPRNRSGIVSWTRVSHGTLSHENVSPRAKEATMITGPVRIGAAATQARPGYGEGQGHDAGPGSRGSNHPTVTLPTRTPAPPAAMMLP